MSITKKKGITIVAIVIVVLIGLMLLIPLMFKGKIKEAVLEVANNNLNAEVLIDDFGLNLFSNFPNATLSLNDAAIIGVERFESDTLLKAKSASVTIDLMSLFGDNFSISKISIDGVSVYAKVLEDGSANWDIMMGDSVVEADAATESSAFNLNLKNITIENSNIVYEDLEGNMKAEILNLNGLIKGDFSASETTLDTKFTIGGLSYTMDGIPFLNKATAAGDARISANFDTMKFAFDESQFKLNELAAGIDGSVTYIKEGELNLDLKLDAPDVDFKQILSLIPVIYAKDFADVQTSGHVALSAYLAGDMKMEEEIYPAMDLKLTVKDAMFKYPSLPKSVDKINLILAVNGDGGSLDNLMVSVDPFSFSLGGNPFKGTFKMAPTVNDKSIQFTAEGKLDLGMIKDVYPLEGVSELNGQLDADLRVATTMSAIEKEQYDKISAEGHFKLSNMKYTAEGLPNVQINTAALAFTSQYVNLSSFDMVMGKSDLSATGRLENFIGYALKNQTLKGNLNIQSKYLDLDELMGDSPAETEDAESSTEDIIIPKNLNFALNASLAQVIFDGISLTNISGNILVKDGTLSMNGLKANALGGSAVINGSYDTSVANAEPKVNFDMKLSNMSFANTFKELQAVQQFAPIFEDLQGTFGMDLKINTTMGATMEQTLKGLSGSGGLQTSNLKLENNETLSSIGSKLNTDKLNNISIKDLNLLFTIQDGAVATKPFSFNFGDGGEMSLEGKTSLDQTIDYKGSIKLPASLNNQYINKVPFTIGGTFASPKVGVDVKGVVSNTVQSVVGGLLGGNSADGSTTDLATKATEAKAEQIQKLRTEADQAAIKIVDAAKKVAKEAEDKASNPIAKAAAKKLGEQGVKKAEQEAQKLRDKAEEQIKQLEGETGTSEEEATTTPVE